jgi:hypothetical protein
MNYFFVVLLILIMLLGSKSFVPLSSPTRRTRKIFSTKKTEELQVLTGIRDIVDQYDTFLLDMWCVILLHG